MTYTLKIHTMYGDYIECEYESWRTNNELINEIKEYLNREIDQQLDNPWSQIIVVPHNVKSFYIFKENSNEKDHPSD